MSIEFHAPLVELPSGSSGTGVTGGRAAARRIAKLAVAMTIVAAFVEVALNPAASISALHFWLALFVAAACNCGERHAA